MYYLLNDPHFGLSLYTDNGDILSDCAYLVVILLQGALHAKGTIAISYARRYSMITSENLEEIIGYAALEGL